MIMQHFDFLFSKMIMQHFDFLFSFLRLLSILKLIIQPFLFKNKYSPPHPPLPLHFFLLIYISPTQITVYPTAPSLYFIFFVLCCFCTSSCDFFYSCFRLKHFCVQIVVSFPPSFPWTFFYPPHICTLPTLFLFFGKKNANVVYSVSSLKHFHFQIVGSSPSHLPLLQHSPPGLILL